MSSMAAADTTEHLLQWHVAYEEEGHKCQVCRVDVVYIIFLILKLQGAEIPTAPHERRR